MRAGAHADDTPAPVLDPGRGRTKTGRLWTAVRDENPYGSTSTAAFISTRPIVGPSAPTPCSGLSRSSPCRCLREAAAGNFEADP